MQLQKKNTIAQKHGLKLRRWIVRVLLGLGVICILVFLAASSALRASTNLTVAEWLTFASLPSAAICFIAASVAYRPFIRK
ncbi:hypothetical protein [Roseimaritima ulvae]|uniref:hypothetical protein n=1 Tax=Roseimaritima ulvae TaxID=980254 RepID=UPI0011CDA1E8|nr:hypothetical protein [Roseimaritima ulvae]